jgi:glycosyltransferase involved in cell wall biosynthesis
MARFMARGSGLQPWGMPRESRVLRRSQQPLRAYSATFPRCRPAMNMRLGILTTHPIQYQVPWFRALAAEPGIDLEVLYCMLPNARQQGSGFGVEFQWDVPLLDGYRYRVLDNRALHPSVTTFFGCYTPASGAIVRNEPWDAFIVNGWVTLSCLQLLAACRRHDVPCIVRGESNVLRPRAQWKAPLHRWLLARYSAFLSIGSGNRDFYCAHGVPADRIFDAPYCVDNERFAFPERLADPQRPFTFLFSGKLIPKKRPLDALEALRALLARTGTHARLRIVGDGEWRNRCEAFASMHGLPVEFAGFVNQKTMPQVYREADCLVLPSDHGETWGLAVNEAMASGLPAIVSDQVGCQADLVTDGVTGFTYPCGDVGALADRMRAVSASRETAWRMGQAACRRVLDNFSYRQVVAGTLAALSAVRPARHARRAVPAGH